MEETGELDLYNRKDTFEKALEKLDNSEICLENKEIIRDYIAEYCLGLSYGRKAKYLSRYHWFARLLKKPFVDATREDIKLLETAIESKPAEMYSPMYGKWVARKQKCSPTTIADNKGLLRRLYRWIEHSYRKNEKIDRYKGTKLRAILRKKSVPALVEDVVDDTPFVRKIRSKDMLSWEEMVAISQATTCPRDLAATQVLGESGLRSGELLALRICDCTIKDLGGTVVGEIHINRSKTENKNGLRTVAIVNSVPALVNYLRQHPFKTEPSAPLWLFYPDRFHNVDRSNPRPMSSACLHKILTKAAKKAGINKKVNPQRWRASRASMLGHILTEAQLKLWFGWVPASKVLNHYLYLDEERVHLDYLRSEGVNITDNKPNQMIEEIKPVRCSACNTVNPAGEYFCVQCNRPLGEQSAALRQLGELIKQEIEKRLKSTA